MSYPKANLGAIVLPMPDGTYTFEEYKNKYGIDLDEILDPNPEVYYVPRTSISKLILLQDVDYDYAFTQLNVMNIINPHVNEDGAYFTYLGYGLFDRGGNFLQSRGIKISLADKKVQSFYIEI